MNGRAGKTEAYAPDSDAQRLQGCFCAQCVDAKNVSPLRGVVFALSRYLEEEAIYTSVSNASGQVFFGPLVPGKYHLEAVETPPNYMGLSIQYAVRVCQSGYVTIGDEPADGFRLFFFQIRLRS